MHPVSSPSSIISPFDDNFTPSSTHVQSAEGLFTKLPDSEEYLAVLERKLRKVQQSSSDQKNSLAKDILKSLGESRESCMLNLLTVGNTTAVPEESTFEEFKVNQILSKINPEKQALGAEELVQLVKADQLELESTHNVSEAESKEDPNTLSS